MRWCGRPPLKTGWSTWWKAAPGLFIGCIRSLPNDSTAGTGAVMDRDENAPGPKWVSPAHAALPEELGIYRVVGKKNGPRSYCPAKLR
jgi:hypothetical protein